MTKKQMLKSLTNQYFELKDNWMWFRDMSKDESKDMSFRNACKDIARDYHSESETIARIAKEFFDVDLFEMWLDA